MAEINATSSPFNLTPANSNWPYEPLEPKQGLILFLITLPGFVGNIVAFAVTVKLVRTHNIAANYLVLALTLTDFYGIFLCTLPTLLCYLYKKWTGGQAMCNFQGFSALFASLASGFLATALAFDRLLAITKPFKYKKIVNPSRAIVTSVGIWIVSMVLALIPVAGIGRYKRNLTGTFCTIDWFAESASNIAFASIYGIIGIILISVVVYCNVKVILGLRKIKQKRRTELHGNVLREDRQKSASDKLEQQFARTVCVISVLFLICWLPFMIRILCNLAGWWTDPWADVQVSRLLLLNFVLDPFLYSFSRKQCRKILFQWFCCCLVNKSFFRGKVSFRGLRREKEDKHSRSSQFHSKSKTGTDTFSSDSAAQSVV